MIYYVRHGESQDNLKGVFSGSRDIALTEKGVKQAQVTAEELKDVKFDACYCSTLLRAKQTLSEVLKHHKDLEVNYDSRIVERSYGVLEGKDKILYKNTVDFKNRYLIGYKMNIEGFEIVEDLIKRVNNFYDDILNKHKDKNILIVAHAGFGRASHVYFNGLPKDKNLGSINLKNAEAVTFEPKEEKILQECSL